MSTEPAILDARQLTRQFAVKKGTLSAVSHVDLAIHRNETVALVGESGSGKTTLSRLLLLLDKPSSGELCFQGTSTSTLDSLALKAFRRAVQPVFQNPFSSLNPRMRVRNIVAEPLFAQGIKDRREIAEQVTWALTATGLRQEDGEKYPHQFSGGQRQRVAIARAIISRPQLIILDEPVSSQDISIQAQILNLLKDLQQSLAISYLFIAHDLATVRFMSDRVAVMYLGRIVEIGDSEALFQQPSHPYTQSLFASVLPDLPGEHVAAVSIQGEIPSPLDPPPGCAFNPRCPRATERCRREMPPLHAMADGREVACFYAVEPELAHE